MKMRLNVALTVACAALALSGGQRHPAMHYDRYWNDYTQSFVTKIFLKSKTRAQVSTTMDQARDIIRRTWEVSGGIHQIIYLVGWQYDGHDSKYPSWDRIGGVILAYSTAGCDRDISLPQAWAGCTALTGTSFPSGKSVALPVDGKKVHLTLARNESLVLKRLRQ
jgi:hypothetical protein